jgi:hypothetical protein
MPQGAILVKWGEPIRGREADIVQHADEAATLGDDLIAEGRIRAVRVFMNATGNTQEWAGTLIMEGDLEDLRELQHSERFAEMLERAHEVAQNVSVVLAIGGAPKDVVPALRKYAERLPLL